VALDDRLCDLEELASCVLRLGAEKLERCSLVDRLPCHHDPLRPLDHGTASERTFQVCVFGVMSIALCISPGLPSTM
jgi:hypothetical protein